MLQLRNEMTTDFPILYTFIQEVFATAHVADGTEQDFVAVIRASETYLPNFSYVLEKNGEIIGHIMLSKAVIEASDGTNPPLLLLAPLSIKFSERAKGYGSILVRYAIDEAIKAGGYPGIIVVGDPTYYQRFGFKLAVNYSGVKLAADLPKEHTMYLVLDTNKLPKGRISI